MQLYVADYLADTIHLDTDEHGAYLLLIMNYWQTGKPIPVNRLQAITKLSNDRWTTVEHTLSEYFNVGSTHWQHDRIDADLLMVEQSQTQRSKAGKASAEARKRARQATEKSNKRNERSTTVEQALNETPNARSTNKETETDIETDIETEKSITSTGADFSKHLIEKHHFDPIRTKTGAANVSQFASWASDGVTIPELDDAISIARQAFEQKGDQDDPPIKYLAKIIASNRKKQTPVSAGTKNENTRDYDNKDYHTPMAAKFGKTA